MGKRVKSKKKGQKRREYSEIRLNLLKSLGRGEKTLNELSRKSKVNWRTCSNHLIYLKGMELVEEIFSSKYVRIFRISKKGKKELSKSHIFGLNKDNKEVRRKEFISNLKLKSDYVNLDYDFLRQKKEVKNEKRLAEL